VQTERSQDAKERTGQAWDIDPQLNLIQGSRSLFRKNEARGGGAKPLTSLLLALQPTTRLVVGHQHAYTFRSRIHTRAEHPQAVLGQFKKAIRWFTRPVVSVTVSVDWEGMDLLDENVRAFEAFRKAHPDVPLTHFLNAAYFTKSNVNQASARIKKKRCIGPKDGRGLHIHPWRSLVESAGVRYRSDPSWSEAQVNLSQGPAGVNIVPNETAGEIPQSTWWQDEEDEGYDIPLGAYTADEIQAIVAKSKQILEEQGISVGQTFRAGAFLATPNVREAIRREGIHIDSSAIDINKWIPGCSFSGLTGETWTDITNSSQPFHIETPAGPILEMPDTGALADYVSAKDMVDHVDRSVEQRIYEDRFAHIGFHQETAAEHVSKVIQAITEIKEKHGNRVVFETLENSGRRAMLLQRLKWQVPLRQSIQAVSMSDASLAGADDTASKARAASSEEEARKAWVARRGLPAWKRAAMARKQRQTTPAALTSKSAATAKKQQQTTINNHDHKQPRTTIATNSHKQQLQATIITNQKQLQKITNNHNHEQPKPRRATITIKHEQLQGSTDSQRQLQMATN
jgi:hypothetical protein